MAEARAGQAERAARLRVADRAKAVRTVNRAARTGAMLGKLVTELAGVEAQLQAEVGAADEGKRDAVYSVDHELGEAQPALSPPPLNRAQRRRAAKLKGRGPPPG